MLAGQAQQLETCVYKSKMVSGLWEELPIVFRIVLLPAVLYIVAQQFIDQRDFVLLNLGRTGEELTLTNEHLAQSPDDPGGTKLVAYAAEHVYPIKSGETPVRQATRAFLTLLQTIVWCVKGEDIVLIGLGSTGGELPEWAWEFVQHGPQITNVRLKSFDSAGHSNGEGGGGPPTGHPGGTR